MHESLREMLFELFEDPVDRLLFASTLGLLPVLPLQGEEAPWIYSALALSTAILFAATTLVVRLAAAPALETDDEA